MAFMKKAPPLAKVDLQERKPSEKEIDKFITAGGLVAADKKNQEEWIKILLRIRWDAIQQIDEELKDRMGMTRTAWILEAIQEKLNRKND